MESETELKKYRRLLNELRDATYQATKLLSAVTSRGLNEVAETRGNMDSLISKIAPDGEDLDELREARDEIFRAEQFLDIFSKDGLMALEEAVRRLDELTGLLHDAADF
jgi:hypothetical protein